MIICDSCHARASSSTPISDGHLVLTMDGFSGDMDHLPDKFPDELLDDDDLKEREELGISFHVQLCRSCYEVMRNSVASIVRTMVVDFNPGKKDAGPDQENPGSTESESGKETEGQ